MSDRRPAPNSAALWRNHR